MIQIEFVFGRRHGSVRRHFAFGHETGGIQWLDVASLAEIARYTRATYHDTGVRTFDAGILQIVKLDLVRAAVLGRMHGHHTARTFAKGLIPAFERAWKPCPFSLAWKIVDPPHPPSPG